MERVMLAMVDKMTESTGFATIPPRWVTNSTTPSGSPRTTVATLEMPTMMRVS